MTERRYAIETTAQAYLQLLHDRGVEYFFGNAGTDFASIIDAFARAQAQGLSVPVPVTVPHEGPAVAMAYGYYMVSGRPQVVMVHVNVGTANALAGIINASRDRVPILFTAGRTPITEGGASGSRDLYIHWAQESFDQAAMVREYVKWDYELRRFDQLEAVVDRGLELAMSEPRGPVYLTLPREVLAEPHREVVFTSPSRRPGRARSAPLPEATAAAVRILAQAQRPVVITATAGRDEAAVQPLVALAERLALPVVEFHRRAMSFPTDHPLHLGVDPAPLLAEADAVLVLESDVPWFADVGPPPAQAKVIHAGVDPHFARYAMRSFPCDVALTGRASTVLAALLDAVGGAGDSAQIEARRARLSAVHEAQRAEWRAAAEAASTHSPISPVWLSRCIDAVKDDDTILLNEYDLVPTQVTLTRPGSFFGSSSASGLGWALGAALGAKLAAPDRLVIATVGDGAYMFGNPTPAHFVSAAQRLPVLFVVFNNGVWGAVQQSNRTLHPEGWAARANRIPLSELEPSPAYEMLCAANGGYGERVDRPEEVRPALERALHAVRVEGRQALLNVIVARP